MLLFIAFDNIHLVPRALCFQFLKRFLHVVRLLYKHEYRVKIVRKNFHYYLWIVC